MEIIADALTTPAFPLSETEKAYAELIVRCRRYREALQEIADGRWNVGREHRFLDVRTFARGVLRGSE